MTKRTFPTDKDLRQLEETVLDQIYYVWAKKNKII